ncbi:MAG: TlpA disulfide reductase family protein [Thermodesulfovibrionia bacterium]|nr:TlpA disulfide reductase family protein [Thermodesulfovibrionia bacterium]
MKYKGLIMVVLIAIAVALLLFLPEKRTYKKIASVGVPAPAFELKDADGNLWKLSDLKGKVVLVNFWATWCSVCKSEKRSLENLYMKVQDKPLQMLGILFRDNPNNLISYFQRQKVSYPTLIGNDNEVAGQYGITGVPETFIIDKNGIIREKIVGPRDWDAPEAMALIEKWL